MYKLTGEMEGAGAKFVVCYFFWHISSFVIFSTFELVTRAIEAFNRLLKLRTAMRNFWSLRLVCSRCSFYLCFLRDCVTLVSLISWTMSHESKILDGIYDLAYHSKQLTPIIMVGESCHVLFLPICESRSLCESFENTVLWVFLVSYRNDRVKSAW